MEVILLGIYSFFVWLIFFKFKWLPWNITSQVIVVTLPIIGLTMLILVLNVVAPSSADVRVINYVVQVVPRVTGRVIEVPIEPNRLVKKGGVLFRIDPVPFRNEVAAAEAKLVEARARLNDAGAKLSEASAGARELRESLKAAGGQVGAISAKLDLARKRVEQNRELVATGAGSRFDLERAETDSSELQSQLDSARASEATGGAEALRPGRRRPGAGGVGQGAAGRGQRAGRERRSAARGCELETVGNHRLRGGRRLRDQHAVAGRLHRVGLRRPAGDELRRERAVGDRALHAERVARTSSPATRRRSRCGPTRTGSSSARWTRSSGRPARASCPSARARAARHAADAEQVSRSSSRWTARTRICSSPPARSATARSTRNPWR